MITKYVFHNGIYIPIFIHCESYLFKLPILRNFVAITLGRHIFCKGGSVSSKLFKHEAEHIKQQIKEGSLVFYIKYLREFFLRYYKQRDFMAAYHSISYEVEARKAEEKI